MPSASAPAELASPPLSSFVGRERELAEIRRIAPSTRLITLTGPGGVGKSRLAAQAAAEASTGFADGLAFVPLATIRDASLVASAIAQAIGAWEQGARPMADYLVDVLRARHLLLLLDNFEQVPTAAPLVAGLLDACPQLAVLVTSREALHLPIEVVFVVPPLALPDPGRPSSASPLVDYDAVRLFADRATQVRPDFVLTDERAAIVAQICRRLDGLPLAIELAAARIRTLDPEKLLERLVRRLPVLVDGGPRLPPRQRTLGDTIGWSYDLLDPVEQRLFRCLSVFADGATVEAVQAVCAGNVGAGGQGSAASLRSLVDKSLLRAEGGGLPANRFLMLETIREYAAAQLRASEEWQRVHARHAAYFLALAAAIEPHLRGGQPVAGLERLEVEHANARAALEWCLEHDALTGLQLAGALWWFWTLRGYWSEGRDWLNRTLQQPGAAGPTKSRAKALYGAGHLAVLQGDYRGARPLLQESVAIWRSLGDKQGIADALHWLGREFSHPSAGSWLQESLELRTELDDRPGMAEALGSLGEHARQAGDIAAGRALGEQSLAMWRALGDNFNLALELYRLGHVARHQGEYGRARRVYDESLELNRALGHKWGVAMTLQNLGFVEQHEGNPRRAAALARESLLLNRELGNKWGICRSFHLLAAVAGADEGGARLAKAESAARLLGAAATLKAAIGMAWQPEDRAEHTRWVARLRETLGAVAFDAAWSHGAAWPIDHAITYALTEEI